MNDTPPTVEQKFRRMLLKRSGAERLKMGCSMYATARALAKAAISQKYPDAGPAELKRLLFLHFYGVDFEPAERDRIASALSRAARSRRATQADSRHVVKPAKSIARVAESSAPYRTKQRTPKRGNKR